MLALQVAFRWSLRVSSASAVAARHIRSLSTPLPVFHKDEPGLMTADEYLAFRNPGDKHHPSDSYDIDIVRMNQEYPSTVGTYGNHGDDRVTIEKLSGGYRYVHDGKVVGIIHGGVAYFDNPHWKHRIQSKVYNGNKDVEVPFTSFKQVKYLAEVMPLISPIAKRNEEKYPVTLQRIIVKGEPLTIKAEETPKLNKGTSIAIINSEGLVVAMGSNEWGATLLRVVQEYRGAGISKILAKVWYEHNPSFESGGYTPAGQRLDLAVWRDRVHEFAERGWYTELVHEGKLTIQRVKEILQSAGERAPKVPHEQAQNPEQGKPTGDILVYSDGETSFVVYDRAFLEDPDEKFLHGYGFLRDDEHKGVFFYRIDYDRPFANLVTRVGLQLARDNGEDLYDGEGYHDMMEVEGIPGVVKEGDYIKITRDLVPLKAMASKERRLRKVGDPYREKENLLLEMAESKWQ